MVGMWGHLYSQYGDYAKPYLAEPIQQGRVVTVKLDSAFNISFAVNGVEKGTPYKMVAKDHSI